MDILGAIGAINALLLVFLLGTKKRKAASDKVLITWVLNFFLYFGYYFLFERQVMKSDVLWTLLWGISLVAHPVFLYVYTLSLTRRNFKFNLKVASNFLLIIPWGLSMIPYLLLTPEEQIRLVYDKQFISHELLLPMMIQLCIELFFFIRALMVIIQHQQNIKQEFSHQAKINLAWLKLLIYLYLILLGASMAGYSLASSNILNIKVMDDLLMLVRLLLFFYMIYHGFKQKLIYASDLTTHSPQTERPGKPEPAASNSEEKPVPESEDKETIMKLRKLMLEESLYLKQELSLGETANKLGIHAHQLSKLLNAQLQKSFFEFVNEYRVDEFKKLVSDPKNKHLSLLGLAMEAGFNSKATFNRFFKKSMGITPSEFRKSHQP